MFDFDEERPFFFGYETAKQTKIERGETKFLYIKYMLRRYMLRINVKKIGPLVFE